MPKSAIPTQKGGSGANIDTFTLPPDPSVQFSGPVPNAHREILIDQPYEATFSNTSYRMIGRNGTPGAPGINPTQPRAYAALSMVDAGGTYGIFLLSVRFDLTQTGSYAITDAPMPLRLVRGSTANLSGGDTLTRVHESGSTSGSFALGQFHCDASADGTNSTTGMTIATDVATGVSQEYFPRHVPLASPAGYQASERIEFDFSKPIMLVNGECVVLKVHAPSMKDFSTNHMVVSMRWGVRTL